MGCLAGLWLHFIPCIWWTCDWSINDGEEIRGGIWFALWLGFSIAGWVYNFGGYKTSTDAATDGENEDKENSDTMLIVIPEKVIPPKPKKVSPPKPKFTYD